MSRSDPPVAGRHALVIDDDRALRGLFTTLLGRNGFTVDVAGDGRIAFDQLNRHNYSVILLDLMMPDVNGFDILELIAGGDVTSPPVVQVITGAERSALARLDPQRIHGIIRKPFDPEEIARLVVACAEIKSRNPFGPMAIATMLAGSPLLALLNRL